MNHYAITSKRHAWFRVDLGACELEHANSVHEQLLIEPTAPSDLTLVELEAPPRSLWARLLRRG